MEISFRFVLAKHRRANVKRRVSGWLIALQIFARQLFLFVFIFIIKKPVSRHTRRRLICATQTAWQCDANRSMPLNEVSAPRLAHRQSLIYKTRLSICNVKDVHVTRMTSQSISATETGADDAKSIKNLFRGINKAKSCALCRREVKHSSSSSPLPSSTPNLGAGITNFHS